MRARVLLALPIASLLSVAPACQLFAPGTPCVSATNCGPGFDCSPDNLCVPSHPVGGDEGEGEGAAASEGEGEGGASSEGEGEGEGASGEGEGEGGASEGEGTSSEGEGEGASGEGEGEGASGEGEGEGAVGGDLVRYTFENFVLSGSQITIPDQSGNGNALAIETSTLTLSGDVDGLALTLDASQGTAGTAPLTPAALGSSSFTVSFCVDNIGLNASGIGIPFQMGGVVVNEPGVSAEFRGSKWLFKVAASQAAATRVTNGGLGGYHCVAAVLDRDTGVLAGYLDGAQVDGVLVGASFGAIDGATPLTLGGDVDGSHPLNGLIDDFFIAPRALTESEIRAAHALVPLQKALFARYSFEEDVGSFPGLLHDASGSGNTATAFGSVALVLPDIQGTRSFVIDEAQENAGFTATEDRLLENGGPITLAVLFETQPDAPTVTEERNIVSIVDSFGIGVALSEVLIANGDIALQGVLHGSVATTLFACPVASTSSVHALALTIDGANVAHGYCDGALVGDIALDAGTGSVTNAGGLVAGGNTLPFHGAVDDVRLYSRALDATEIAELVP